MWISGSGWGDVAAKATCVPVPSLVRAQSGRNTLHGAVSQNDGHVAWLLKRLRGFVLSAARFRTHVFANTGADVKVRRVISEAASLLE